MKLWVDDERPMPEGFDFHVKTAAEAINLIYGNQVTKISLDHDLGEGKGTGYDIARFIETHADQVPPLQWTVHSMNPVGRKNIEAAMRNAEKIWEENRPSCPYCFNPMVVDGREYYCVPCDYSV